MYCEHCVEGFGDVTDFFSDNIWGQAIWKLTNVAASTAASALIQRELGPKPGQLGSGGQIRYGVYNTLPGSPGTVPPVVAQPPAGAAPAGSAAAVAGQDVSGTDIAAPDYEPWILAGAGALLLLAILS